MLKRKITLQFPTLHLLWNFAQLLKTSSMEINTSKKSLTCDCSEIEIALGIEEYRAIAVHRLQENSN